MRKKLTRFTCALLTLCLVLPLFSGCTKKTDDIVILFTNDVHCAIDESIGYAGLASYKADCLEKTPYVMLVDCGDAIQGDVIGTLSDGEYIVDIMNKVGYDYAILGNHEFDYGMEQISALIERANAEYLGCNLTYSGSGDNKLSSVLPYAIKNCGGVDVAFIGVSTPKSKTSSAPTNFQENGEFVYSFSGSDGNELYAKVQQCADECREKGAEYVVVLSHLGDGMETSPFTSTELINNTNGIDALLDGHSHSVVPCRVADNKDGSEVLIASTGYKLSSIGQLVISADGYISTGLITDYTKKDTDVTDYIDEIRSGFEAEMSTVAAVGDTALSCYDESGVRLVRTRETTIGDFCADAYRVTGGADIGFINGGGIRADIPAGNITYADMIAVNPYGNTLCVVEASGQEILDALEVSCRSIKSAASENGEAYGEIGGFLQVSGLKFTVDTSVESTVAFDEDGMFASVDGARRVSDVCVLSESGDYLPIEADKTYTVASHNYLIKKCGDGYTMFADNKLIIDEGILDYQMLIDYIRDNLGGNLGSKYSVTDGRITVK